MTWLVQPRLVNDPFSDPALFIDFRFGRRALLFDLGEVTALSARELLRVTHAFVSHTHMDHFAGFDRLLRLCLHRTAPLHLVGPAGFLDQVEHKLRAYNWNLLDEDSLDFTLTAAEFTAGGVGGVCGFRAREAFRRRELALPPLAPGTLLDEEEFRIESVVLDHGTPCLALAFQEKLRINVWREGLDLLKLPVGPWLNEAKRAVRRGAPDDSRILIRDDRFVPLGVLKQHALRSAPGHRIVTWSTPLSMHRTSRASPSSHAAPTSSSSRQHSWTRTPSSPPKGAISPPRRRARSQRTRAFPAWCRFISLLDTSTGRINFDGRSKPRGEDEAAGHVLRACEVADFAEHGCPKSRLLCKNRKAETSANGHLNFNDALRK